MKKLFQQVFTLESETKDEGEKRLIIYVLLTGVIFSFIFALININGLLMFFLGAISLVGLMLAVRNQLEIARWVSLFSALALVASLVFQNYGIRDTAMPGLMVVLVASGLLAGRKGTVIFGSLILGIVIALGALEKQGIIQNRFSGNNFFADYLTTCIIIVILTTLQWLMITRLKHNIQRSRQELKERENAQKLLREAENRYRNLVEQIPAVVYIAEPGQSGRWHYVNPQIMALIGFTQDEWLKDPNLWFNQIHPDDQEKTVKDEKRAITSGDMPHLEYRLITKDGRIIWVYDEGMRLVDSEDHLILQGFMIDITARKVAEEQLEKRLAELDAVRGVSEALVSKTDLKNLIEQTGEQIRITFGAASLFIALLDPTSDVIHFPYYFDENKRMDEIPLTFGKGMTSSVIKMRQPLLINSDWEKVSSKYGAIYYDNNPAKSSLTVPLMIGEKGIGAISVQDMKNENTFTDNDVRLLSTIAANLAVAVENTRLQESLKQELKIQEKLVRELELKNAELERFTYTASHDLKSPLITIRGFLGYLERDAQIGNFERLQKDVQRISEATEKMHKLLNDLLELSRVGRVINTLHQLSFEEVVNEALERVSGQLTERQVKAEVGSGFPTVFGDKERLVEVVQNLVDNACKFMGDEPEPLIKIGVQQNQKHEYIFYVKDNGIGIKKDFHEKVFGLFNKLDSNSDGTGIGLALVKRIIEVHNGRIWIESDGVEKGTSICFTLPTMWKEDK